MSLLTIEGLRKGYRLPDGSERLVLDVPAFTLAEKAQVALRGSSGSGKTTLLHCIAGILRPDAGTVEVAGTNVAALSEGKRDAFRARHIGYVFQTFNLLQGYSALENVELGMFFGRGADVRRATELLTSLGLGDRLHDQPSQLSAGQQQRVALARALANQPELVLADEPTGNLDADRAGEALDLIRDTCTQHGAALLLVSHDPAALAHFDEVVDLAAINHAAKVANSAGGTATRGATDASAGSATDGSAS